MLGDGGGACHSPREVCEIVVTRDSGRLQVMQRGWAILITRCWFGSLSRTHALPSGLIEWRCLAQGTTRTMLRLRWPSAVAARNCAGSAEIGGGTLAATVREGCHPQSSASGDGTRSRPSSSGCADASSRTGAGGRGVLHLLGSERKWGKHWQRPCVRAATHSRAQVEMGRGPGLVLLDAQMRPQELGPVDGAFCISLARSASGDGARSRLCAGGRGVAHPLRAARGEGCDWARDCSSGWASLRPKER